MRIRLFIKIFLSSMFCYCLLFFFNFHILYVNFPYMDTYVESLCSDSSFFYTIKIGKTLLHHAYIRVTAGIIEIFGSCCYDDFMFLHIYDLTLIMLSSLLHAKNV